MGEDWSATKPTRDRELEQRAEEIRRRDAALEREQQLAAIFAERLRELEAPRESREGAETPEESAESAVVSVRYGRSSGGRTEAQVA